MISRRFATIPAADFRYWQIVLQKSFCEVGLKFSDPQVQRSNHDAGTTSPSAKLTGDFGSAFEALLIGDCRLFRFSAKNWPLRLLELLQHYRHISDITRCPT
jgi:hypothetical protein